MSTFDVQMGLTSSLCRVRLRELGNDLATLASSHGTQFLDLTCGKTSFWRYPQAVRRITLISAGAGDKI